MSRISVTSVAWALPFALVSQAAVADLTPTEVWGDWRAYLESAGYTVEAGEAVAGNALTVSNIRLGMPMPADEGVANLSLGTLTFQQNADGSVSVVMPAMQQLRMNMTAAEPDAKPVQLDLSFTQNGHALTARGSIENITYDYAAESLAMVLDQLQVGDETYGEQNAKFKLAATGVKNATTVTVDQVRSYQQKGTIASVEYDIFVDNPEDSTKLKLAGGLSGLTLDGGGAIPLEIIDAEDMAAMIKAGFKVSGQIAYTQGRSDAELTDPENGSFKAATTSGGGTLDMKMGAEGLAYSGAQKDLAVAVNVAEMPFPIEFSMAEGGFNLAVPVSKSETPQGFALGLTLAQFKMSDLIWSIFDPAGQLPRDPATLKVDLAGKATMLTDILDPEAAAKLGDTPPGKLETLRVNTLLLDAVGAKLSGSGDVTFDNTDTTTFDGMPKPEGALDLSLAGGNALLDKLVAMGLIPADQAMGARMMMGLFTVPGDAPDTLKSKIEFTPDGQVLANGQRIK